MASRSTHPLPERTLRFEYPGDMDPAWSPRRPEFAYAANAVSLIMPFAEPYFVRSVRSAISQLDGTDRTTAEEYLRQELQHHVQHRRFNQIVTGHYPRLTRIEGWMRRTYGWFSRTRSQRFNLAFAAGSETIAFTLARWTEHHLDELFTGAEPVPSTLFLWHLAEEVEHKSAAFDVYEAIDGSRLRYLVAMVMSFVILAWFTGISALAMMHADRRLHHPVSWFRLLKWGLSFAWVGLPTLVVSALPGHHPSDFTDPIWMSSWLTHFDPETGTIPEPSFLRPVAITLD
jgi:predicted metal-dependent hydrolase